LDGIALAEQEKIVLFGTEVLPFAIASSISRSLPGLMPTAQFEVKPGNYGGYETKPHK
jgi:hypothetical protein